MRIYIIGLLVLAVCLEVCVSAGGRRGRAERRGRRGKHHVSDHPRGMGTRGGTRGGRGPMHRRDSSDGDDDLSWEYMDRKFRLGPKHEVGPFSRHSGRGPMGGRGPFNRRPSQTHRWHDSSDDDSSDDEGFMNDRRFGLGGRRGQNWFHGPRRNGHGRFNFGLGPRHDPWFGLDFSWGGREVDDPWWSGPNVCYSKTEGIEEIRDIAYHYSYQSVVCDGSRSTFTCTTKDMTPMGQETVTELYECCPGYTREGEEFGCVEQIALTDIPTLLETLELGELIKLLDASGLLLDVLSDENGTFTIFAPTNEALDTFLGVVSEINPGINLQKDFPNVVIVSQQINNTVLEDTRNILLGHVAVGRLTSSSLADNQIIETASPLKSAIRINKYTRPVEVTTANCVKITSTDNHATNGVIHVVGDVLTPITDTIIELIQKNPELSTFKTLLGTSSVAAELREEGDFTLLVPTDTAFKKHKELFMKIMTHQKCLDNVLKNHLVPHVVCSAVIQGDARTTNALGRILNLTRDADDKLYVDGAQIITSDMMATNGVLYIIDDVLIPDQALGVVELAKKNGLSDFSNLLALSDLKKDLENAENVTVFVPSNEAIKALPAGLLDSLKNDTEALNKVLGYHVVPEVLNCRKFFNNLKLETVEGSELRVNEYSSFPYSGKWKRTVQCGLIQGQLIQGCNGAIYVVDKVLVPPSGNVVDILAQDPRLSTLAELLKIADFAEALQDDGPFTIFAPTNEAFDTLGSDAVKEMKENPDTLKEILLNHVTDGSVCCAAVEISTWYNTQKVRTLSRNTFNIQKTKDHTTYIADTEIIQCDLSATNGVVHVINEVIVSGVPGGMDMFSSLDWMWDK